MSLSMPGANDEGRAGVAQEPYRKPLENCPPKSPEILASNKLPRRIPKPVDLCIAP